MLVTPTPELTTGAHPVCGLARDDGRLIHYLDTGEIGRRPVVFFGGIGTSASAFSLTEFARAQRDRLGLRFISVERNGFGASAFTPGVGFAEAVDDVLSVLSGLEVSRFAVVAISGGGPYAAALIARVPERVGSVHLAAATSGGALMRRGAAADLLVDVDAIVRDPGAFWEYPTDSLVHEIPGFMEAAREEGRRALGDPARAAAALRHEVALLLCADPPDLRALRAPTFLYWGSADPLVPLDHVAVWQARLRATTTTTRIYAREGHDVQYLHWHEILCDIARVAW